MNGKDLEKALLWEAPHIGEKAPEQIPEAQNFCEGYKTFLNEGKTERECVTLAIKMAEEAGYRDVKEVLTAGKPLVCGDKVYALLRRNPQISVGHRAVIHARRCYEGGRGDC